MNSLIISEGSTEETRIKQLLSVAGSTAAGAVAATPTTVAAVAGAIPAGGVGAAAGGYDTAPNRDTFIATVTEIKAQLNSLMTELRNRKFIT